MSTAVISPAAAGLRVLTDPALPGAHHDLTGPVPLSWPEALELLPAEPGEPVTFRVCQRPSICPRWWPGESPHPSS
jgi:hypothetical protein